MSTRSIALGGALLLAGSALGGLACSNEDSVFNVAVGDCVENLDDLSGTITELPSVDCTTDHQGEILFLFQHEGDDGDFPGSDELQDQAREECEGDSFEDYTGTTYAESAIAIAYITPTEDSWGQGDRETICVASTGESVDQSFKDNGEDFLLGA